MRRIALALSIAVGTAAGGASAQQAPQLPPLMLSTGDWGGVGLLQMHTARFAPDGAFEVGYSFVDPFKRYYVTTTFFPWLEATFRYTEVRNKLYSDVPEFSHDQRYKDRGADLKLQLRPEGRFTPALAVGFQDLLGTGLFGGEYLVASKRLGDFDFTVGMGWGSIGSGGGMTNPFGSSQRAGGGAGGQLSVKDFFRGAEVGIFGGVEYQTPFRGVTLKFEYDSNSYESTQLSAPKNSPYNYGLVFRPYPWAEVSFGKERGNTTMLRFALRSDLHGQGIPKLDPPPPPLAPRPTMQSIETTAAAEPPQGGLLRVLGFDTPAPPAAPREPAAGAVADALFDALNGRGLQMESFALSQGEATIGVSRVLTSRETLSATAAAAIAQLPPDVQAVTLVEFSGGLEIGRARSARPGSIALPGAADPLTLSMAAIGVALEEVQVVGATATLRVRSLTTRGVDLTATARAARVNLPPVAAVVVIDTRTGLSETWITGADVAPGPAPAPAPDRAPQVRPIVLNTPQAQRDFTEVQRRAITRQLQDALAAEGMVLEAVVVEGNSAFVSVSAFRYAQVARNEGLAARVVANNLPAEIEDITLAFLNGGLEMSRLSFRRTDLERALAYDPVREPLLANLQIQPGEPGYPGGSVAGRYPRLSWSLSPQLRQHVGGPDRFYLFQAWLSASVGVDIFRGFSVTSQFGKNLYNNFNLLTLESDSLLPKVRSDMKHYLQEGADGNIVRMQTNYLAKPAQDFYVRLSAGLLEEMYGGISGEVLIRPFESRFAVGAELSWVRQRDFDQRFKFRDYTVTTGHLSLYWDTPYRNVGVEAHVGRYLAGDVGVTFEVSRRFDSGVRIGAWATYTDVPPSLFGEGSFDKGVYIVIPFDVFTVRSTRATGTFAFRPLTRDGGQRLVLSHRLYDLTTPASLGEVTRDFGRFLQ